MKSKASAPARATVRDERGQGLVEYALIIALVGLAAVVALGFLSGKINTIFSKAGNVLNNTAQFASGGGGPGGGGLPAVVTPLPGGNVFAPAGSASSDPGDNTGYTGMQGVYSNTGGNTGNSCTFTVNGVTYTGVWVDHEDIPGPDFDWTINGVEYDFACLQISNAPPANGSVNITPAGPVVNITTTTPLTANATGYTGATWYEYDWERTGSLSSTTCSGFSDSNINDNDSGSATDVTNADPGSSAGNPHRCFRVTVTARNAFGDASDDTSNQVRVTRNAS